MTPPGSPCSIIFGAGVTSARPGSLDSLVLVVDDIDKARAELIDCAIDVSEIFHDAEGGLAGGFQTEGRATGPDPQGRSCGSYASFSDPGGNGWLLQEITERLPGPGVTMDVAALAELLHETASITARSRRSPHRTTGGDWYAAYMDARERGGTPEEASSAAGRYMAEVKDDVIPPA